MRTYGKSSLLQQVADRALGVGLLILIASTASAQSPAVDAFNAMGFQKNRNYFSPEPYEHYDTVSGNVMLTFTDLTLPGNAGRSLQFQRTYNNQRVGGQPSRWSFGLAGMVMHVVEATPVPVGFNFNDDARIITSTSPTFIMADNGRHPTMPVVQPNSSSQTLLDQTTRIVMSGEFHKYDRSTHTMFMADGIVAHYALNGTDPVTGRPRFSLASFEDLYENAVTLAYAADTLTVVQDLGNDQVRTINFLKVGDRITSMTFYGRVWQYTYDSSMDIVSVTLPEVGLAWTFDYDVELTEITTPNGGRIQYVWEDVLVEPVPGDMSQNFTRHFLHYRKSWDRDDVLLGTWTLTWGNQFDDPISFGAAILLPSGVTVSFGNAPLTTTPGLLFTGGYGVSQRVIQIGPQVIETENLGFVAVPVIRYSAGLWWGTPELSSRTVIRGTRTYSTQWVYDTSVTSGFSFPWNNHNPTSIVENNNEGLGRTWTRTYTNILVNPGATTLAPYLLGLPATEEIAVSTETFRRTWSYTDPAFPGFLTQSTGFARPNATGVVTTFVADSRGNVATVSTATSSTSYVHEWGTVKEIATGGYTITRTIHVDGTIAGETKAGRTTGFQYDELGRQTVVTPPGGTIPIMTDYAADGSTITTSRGTGPLMSSVTTTLDGFGRPTSTINTQGVRTTTRYNGEGQVTFRSRPFTGSAEVGTEMTYDALGRVRRETHSDNTYREYTYGADTTTIVDEEGRTTEHRFVAFGHPDDARLTIVTDAKQQPWAYAYDVLGRIRNVTAPDGIARTWEYNDQSLLFRETHPESGVTTYQYNTGGLMTQKIDAKGQTFVYTYDGNDRLSTIAVGSALTTVTYEPGSDNRRSMAVDGVQTVFGYDPAGRRSSREDTLDGFRFTTTFGYDNYDHLTSIAYPSFGSSGNRRQIGYEYDSEHRLTRVRDLLVTRDFATDFTYHPSGALLGYTAGNGVPSTVTYHPSRYWMTSLSVGSLWSLQYSNYDDVGNVRSIVDSRAGMNQDLGYDELDRLVSVSAGPGYPPAQWAYDVHGNRTDAYGTTFTYYPGTLRLWTQNTDSHTYDTNGNLLTATTPSRSFTYSAWNRVATATMGGTTTNYRYDADDWRVKKSSGTTTTYLLRGVNGELLTEWKNPGTNGETRDYVYAGSRLVGALTRPWNESPIDLYGQILPDGTAVPVTFTAAGQRYHLTFEAVAGHRYSVKWFFLNGTMSLVAPNGQVLISSMGEFIEPITLTTPGTYELLLDPTGTWTGSLTVRLYDVVDVSGSITANGPAVPVTLTAPGQKARLTFAGTTGQRVSVYASLNSGCLAWPLAVVQADDTPVGSIQGCGEAFVEPVVLPSTGTYRVLVDPQGHQVGTATVNLYNVAADVTGTLTVNAAPTPIALPTVGQKAMLSVAGANGQQVTVRVTGNTIGWVTVRLLKPDQMQLTSLYTWPSAFNLSQQTLPTTGTYTVVVDPNMRAVGNLSVQVTSP